MRSIFNRKECQFTKNNNNNISKSKLVLKIKSENYYKIYELNRKEKYNNDIIVNINKEGENRSLKELIKLSEDKLIMRENYMKKKLMSQNQKRVEMTCTNTTN